MSLRVHAALSKPRWEMWTTGVILVVCVSSVVCFGMEKSLLFIRVENMYLWNTVMKRLCEL